ncbi:MAG: nitroreductase family protein, partial [Ignisphaera sp.]
MDVYEAILSRRSIRVYKHESIRREDLEKILEAARWAPSAGNRQPWHFIVVVDEQIKEKLVPACRNQSFIKDASCVVV